jgi:hypothetical protein
LPSDHLPPSKGGARSADGRSNISGPQRIIGLSVEGHHLLERSKVDIEQHLAKHEQVLRALAFQYGRYDKDLREDCYQAGALALVEAHDRWSYHGAELLTYAWHDVHKAMLKQVKLVRTEYRYGIKEELDTLQEMAEKVTGRYGKDGYPGDRIHLDRLYDEPIEGLKPPLESSLTEDEEELAEKLIANLTKEELALLNAKVGRSDEEAAAFLDIPQTTYWRKRKAAQAKALELAQGLIRS